MSSATSGAAAGSPGDPLIRRLLRATEIDTRMIGMIGALALIWFGFHAYTVIVQGQGLFLTPRNLWNLLVQSSSVGVMAAGMVLVAAIVAVTVGLLILGPPLWQRLVK
jgi:D-xylose transport system permease protein